MITVGEAVVLDRVRGFVRPNFFSHSLWMAGVPVHVGTTVFGR